MNNGHSFKQNIIIFQLCSPVNKVQSTFVHTISVITFKAITRGVVLLLRKAAYQVLLEDLINVPMYNV